jgi:hypothetical protein
MALLAAPSITSAPFPAITVAAQPGFAFQYVLNRPPIMTTESPPAPSAAKKKPSPDRFGNAGASPDPWEECARLEYGADRSYAWAVRGQVIATPPDGRARIEERLLKSLATPGRTDAGLAFIGQMLALVGTAKSVPALAPLLRDAKTADSARFALEPITGPEADAAFRDALGALTGPTKAGVIGSIAARGDATVRPALAALKDAANEPAVVREAAARALARLDQPKSPTP